MRSKYKTLTDASIIEIAPADLAAEAYNKIDPQRTAPPLVQIAAMLELRQLARAICRQQQRDSKLVVEQGNLFDYYLQPRYPVRVSIDDGETEYVYVLRTHMILEERQRNIKRLRREARAKMMHADVLQIETKLREAIREMVRKFRSAGKRFFNEDVVDAVIAANDKLFGELERRLARERLFDLTRQEMKSATEITESEAQLDLGLDTAGFMLQIICGACKSSEPAEWRV